MPLVSDISNTLSSISSGITDMASSAQDAIKNTVDAATKQAIARPVDRRARLRPQQGAEKYVYGQIESNSELTIKQKLANKVLNMAPDAIARIGNELLHTTEAPTGLMSVLQATNGLVFPETPTISEAHTVEYSSYDPVHSLARFNNYVRTQNAAIRISAPFHVTNATEARYLLACIHFLRSITKMDFGRQAKNPGTPPPVLLFSAYGKYMFNDIPVVVKNISLDYDADVDYIQVPLDGNDIKKEYQSVSFYQTQMAEHGKIWVPTKMMIGIQMEQQVSANFLTQKFNLEDFKSGKMLSGGKNGGNGGMI